VRLDDDIKKWVRMCGTAAEGTAEQLSYISYSNSLAIFYKTDEKVMGKGFRLRYKMGEIANSFPCLFFISSGSRLAIGAAILIIAEESNLLTRRNAGLLLAHVRPVTSFIMHGFCSGETGNTFCTSR